MTDDAIRQGSGTEPWAAKTGPLASRALPHSGNGTSNSQTIPHTTEKKVRCGEGEIWYWGVEIPMQRNPATAETPWFDAM